MQRTKHNQKLHESRVTVRVAYSVKYVWGILSSQRVIDYYRR